MTADHLGSPRIITDDDRDVVSRHDYLAFGDEVTETVGNLAGRTTTQGYGQDDDIRKQYTGYERDKESGLDFAQARYYNFQHGRFTSVDPLTASANVKNPQTFNRYSYVMNSPYKFTDPLGLLAVHSSSYGNGLEGGGGGGITGAMSSAWANPLFMKQQQTQQETPPAQDQNADNPTNPNAPVQGSGEITTPTFGELSSAAPDNEIASAAVQLLGSTSDANAQATYEAMSEYNQAVFLNTVSALVDANVNLNNANFEGFYSPSKDDKNPSGIKLSGVTKKDLKNAKMGKTGGDVVGLILRPFFGRRSSGRIKTASLEATINKKEGYIAFDVDLYNPRNLKTFIKHQKEVRFNNKKGATTHPADVARALVNREVRTLVRTP